MKGESGSMNKIDFDLITTNEFGPTSFCDAVRLYRNFINTGMTTNPCIERCCRSLKQFIQEFAEKSEEQVDKKRQMAYKFVLHGYYYYQDGGLYQEESYGSRSLWMTGLKEWQPSKKTQDIIDKLRPQKTVSEKEENRIKRTSDLTDKQILARKMRKLTAHIKKEYYPFLYAQLNHLVYPKKEIYVPDIFKENKPFPELCKTIITLYENTRDIWKKQYKKYCQIIDNKTEEGGYYYYVLSDYGACWYNELFDDIKEHNPFKSYKKDEFDLLLMFRIIFDGSIYRCYNLKSVFPRTFIYYLTQEIVDEMLKISKNSSELDTLIYHSDKKNYIDASEFFCKNEKNNYIRLDPFKLDYEKFKEKLLELPESAQDVLRAWKVLQ